MTENYGYTGKILRVDLSSGSTTDASTMDYVDRFLGGRGLAAKIYWDEAPPEVSPFHPENRLIFATGPLAGLSGVHGSRWQVYAKSPATTPEHFCYSNLGGTWGANLKFAGYDALVVQGKSDRPIYLFIQDGVSDEDCRDLLHGSSLAFSLKSNQSHLSRLLPVRHRGYRIPGLLDYPSLRHC